MKRTLKFGLIAASFIMTLGTANAMEGDGAPPPPPPPPAPGLPVANAAITKADKIKEAATEIVKKDKAFSMAQNEALNDPSNEAKKAAAVTALNELVTNISTLMRLTKSLEGDVAKLLANEKGALTQEKGQVSGQKKVAPARQKAQENLVNELMNRLPKKIE